MSEFKSNIYRNKYSSDSWSFCDVEDLVPWTSGLNKKFRDSSLSTLTNRIFFRGYKLPKKPTSVTTLRTAVKIVYDCLGLNIPNTNDEIKEAAKKIGLNFITGEEYKEALIKLNLALVYIKEEKPKNQQQSRRSFLIGLLKEGYSPKDAGTVASENGFGTIRRCKWAATTILNDMRKKERFGNYGHNRSHTARRRIKKFLDKTNERVKKKSDKRTNKNK